MSSRTIVVLLVIANSLNMFSQIEGEYRSKGTIEELNVSKTINTEKYILKINDNIYQTTLADYDQGVLNIKINSDNSITFEESKYGTLNVTAVMDSTNVYDPIKKEFVLNYEFTTSTGVRRFREVLTYLLTFVDNDITYTVINPRYLLIGVIMKTLFMTICLLFGLTAAAESSGSSFLNPNQLSNSVDPNLS